MSCFDLEGVHAVVLGAARQQTAMIGVPIPSSRACSITRQPSIPGSMRSRTQTSALVAQSSEAGLPVRDPDGVEPGRLEVSRHPASDDVVVFDDEDFRHPATP